MKLPLLFLTTKEWGNLEPRIHLATIFVLPFAGLQWPLQIPYKICHFCIVYPCLRHLQFTQRTNCIKSNATFFLAM